MRFKFILKSFSSAIACLFLVSVLLNGQNYSFKNYGTEYNIPNGFIYTINQAENGFLDRKSTRLNSSHSDRSRMPSSA